MQQPEVLPAVVEQTDLVEKEDAPTLRGFLANMAPFFTKAADLEHKAKRTLTIAQALPPLVTAADDEMVQRFILESKGLKKDAEEHWGICATVSRFHKKLTAGRARTTDPIDQAVDLAQQKHNGYVAAERRRAAEEQERLRKEDEAREQARRNQEIAEAEERALALEAGAENLSAREQAFVTFVVAQSARTGGEVTLTARTVGAKHAGFKDPEKAGQRLMESLKIQKAIDDAQRAIAVREQAEALRQMPIAPSAALPVVQPQVARVGTDVDYWGAELLNEAALIDAVMAGKAPKDLLKIDVVRLNGYGRSMKELVNQWPGVRAKKDTRTR